MKKTLFIVEGTTDKKFFDALIIDLIPDNNMAVSSIINPEASNIDVLTTITQLKTKLQTVKRGISNPSITEYFKTERIGIILDTDRIGSGTGIYEGGFENRLRLINQAIEGKFGTKGRVKDKLDRL